jgi:hypothetical protein
LYGAYGFALEYVGGAGPLRDLVELGTDAPLVTLRWRHACPAATFDESRDGFAAMGTRGATAFYVTGSPPSILFDIGVEPEPDALIHPVATVPLAVLARWRGDVTLHAGAFEAGGAAWALMGDREAGKSTTLGVLAGRGHAVVADDLLVVQDCRVHSGPACVDLRADAAERLGPTRDLGVFGPRRRFRLSGAPAPACLPLGGFLVLGWHDHPTVAVERVSLQDRVRLLYGLEYAGLVGPADPAKILELATLPAWRIERPPDWSATEEAVGKLLELALATASARPATHIGAA